MVTVALKYKIFAIWTIDLISAIKPDIQNLVKPCEAIIFYTTIIILITELWNHKQI